MKHGWGWPPTNTYTLVWVKFIMTDRCFRQIRNCSLKNLCRYPTICVEKSLPSPKPVLTKYQWGIGGFTHGHFRRNASQYLCLTSILILLMKIHIPWAQFLNKHNRNGLLQHIVYFHMEPILRSPWHNITPFNPIRAFCCFICRPT